MTDGLDAGVGPTGRISVSYVSLGDSPERECLAIVSKNDVCNEIASSACDFNAGPTITKSRHPGY